MSPNRYRTKKEGLSLKDNPLILKAGLTRLELATSDVTGRGLAYHAIYLSNEISTLWRPHHVLTHPLYPYLYPHTVIHSVIGR